MEKFLFNQNIFDEPEEEEVLEPKEPPAPTFSEEELENARKTAFEEAYKKGRAEAEEEARNSRSQLVATTLQQIASSAGILFTGEDKRDNIFEAEALKLTVVIIRKLFPLFLDTYGEKELGHILQTVLMQQKGQSKIHIEVSKDTQEGVDNFLNQLKLEPNHQQRFSVTQNDTLTDYACALSWEDGGAIRDIEALSEEIFQILQQTLAGSGTNSHDSIVDGNTSSTQMDAAPDESPKIDEGSASAVNADNNSVESNNDE